MCLFNSCFKSSICRLISHLILFQQSTTKYVSTTLAKILHKPVQEIFLWTKKLWRLQKEQWAVLPWFYYFDIQFCRRQTKLAVKFSKLVRKILLLCRRAFGGWQSLLLLSCLQPLSANDTDELKPHKLRTQSCKVLCPFPRLWAVWVHKPCSLPAPLCSFKWWMSCAI